MLKRIRETDTVQQTDMYIVKGRQHNLSIVSVFSGSVGTQLRWGGNWEIMQALSSQGYQDAVCQISLQLTYYCRRLQSGPFFETQ